MRYDLMHPAEQLVMIMNRIYKYGMTTTSGGNLSIRDDNGDIWITPSAIDKGALTPRDIVCVKSDGEILGIHKPSIELPFHRNIYQARPDIRAVVHAHPSTLVAYSLSHCLPDIRMIPNAKLVCGEVGVAPYFLPGSDDLANTLTARFAEGYNAVLMENHGAVCGGEDILQAFMRFETLEFCGRMDVNVRRLGSVARSLTDDQIAFDQVLPEMKTFIPGNAANEERTGRRAICEMAYRAYDQRLFTSSEGTISVRLPGDAFLITPYMKDRRLLEPEDIVLVQDGKCEAGKQPSRAASLHQKIYRQHPKIGALIMAQPAAIMAFAVADAKFDVAMLPESYVMLQDIRRQSFGAADEEILNAFSPSTNVQIEENRAVIVAGENLLKAFDRLEVLECGAKSIIDAGIIAPIQAISEEGIAAIKAYYKLP